MYLAPHPIYVTKYGFEPRDKKEELLCHIVCLIKFTKSEFQPIYLFRQKKSRHIEKHVIRRYLTGQWIWP
jgi:hypothetical protein